MKNPAVFLAAFLLAACAACVSDPTPGPTPTRVAAPGGGVLISDWIYDNWEHPDMLRRAAKSSYVGGTHIFRFTVVCSEGQGWALLSVVVDSPSMLPYRDLFKSQSASRSNSSSALVPAQVDGEERIYLFEQREDPMGEYEGGGNRTFDGEYFGRWLMERESIAPFLEWIADGERILLGDSEFSLNGVDEALERTLPCVALDAPPAAS